MLDVVPCESDERTPHPIHPMSKSSILEALLDSIRVQLRQLHCLDISTGQLAKHWIQQQNRAAPSKPGEATEAGYDLVVCDAESIERALEHCRGDGLVLVREERPHFESASTSRQEPPHSASSLPNLAQIAHVRAAHEQWRLFTRVRSPETRDLCISVVVQCQDQAPGLAGLLTLLAVDQSAVPWELVVVDRGSFDETSALLRAVEGDMVLLRRPRETELASGLHAALQRCKAPLAVVISPDLVPELDWFQAVVDAAKDHPSISCFSGIVIDGQDGVDTARHHPPAVESDFCPELFAIRLDSYRATGGFDLSKSYPDALRGLIAELGAHCFVTDLRARRPKTLARRWHHSA